MIEHDFILEAEAADVISEAQYPGRSTSIRAAVEYATRAPTWPTTLQTHNDQIAGTAEKE